MKKNKANILILVTMAIPLIGFIILSGCMVTGTGDGGGTAVFPGGLPIERVSVNDAGQEGDNLSFAPSLSTDGRYVAFYSSATNLVAEDTNNFMDVFVYDREYDTIERVSVNNDGVQGGNNSFVPSISGDGRYVAFHSDAANLVSPDENMKTDIFVFDRTNDTIERVSVGTGGEEANDSSSNPSISRDGRYVAFSSLATDLVTPDGNDAQDIFVYDRTTDTIERVSVSDAGEEGNSFSFNAKISADGRYVAFSSLASNLVPVDEGAYRDIFVYDRTNDTIEMVSVDKDGVQGNNDSFNPSISEDGRYVAFSSLATDLVTPDGNAAQDIFVYDRTNDTIEMVSVDKDGVQGNGQSYKPSISRDGRYVAFYSEATNLVLVDEGGYRDIFVYDRTNDTIERVSVDADGVQGDNNSLNPTISPDGRYVAFESDSENLVSEDNNGLCDIFVAPVGQ